MENASFFPQALFDTAQTKYHHKEVGGQRKTEGWCWKRRRGEMERRGEGMGGTSAVLQRELHLRDNAAFAPARSSALSLLHTVCVLRCLPS